MEKRRIEYFDTAKFIGMMMIILGHFGVPEINRFVYTFHIPLFFLISGYFYAPRESTVLLVKNKFRQLIIPYILVMLVVICIYGIQNWYKGISLSETGRGIFSYIIGYFYGSGYIDNIMGHKIQTVGPIWFCLALFWGFLFLNFILKRKHCLFWAVSLFAAGYYSAFYIWLPFSIQSGMTAVLFIYLGYEAKFFHIMDKIPSIGKIFPLLCIWGICIGYGGQFLFVQNYSRFPITDSIAAIAASYLVLLYSWWLQKNTSAARVMAFLGKYTIVMLCLHSIDVNIMPWNDYYKTPNTDGGIILTKILITLVKFIFPIFGALAVSRYSFLQRIFAIKN